MIAILSIDGGGIRGIIPATFLAEFEKRTGQPICALFDIIAGTSTGGILAATLTLPNRQEQAEIFGGICTLSLFGAWPGYLSPQPAALGGNLRRA